MSELVLVVPPEGGAYEDALTLFYEGPPFELEGTAFARHRVYATKREIVFVFESPGLRQRSAVWPTRSGELARDRRQ